jgi:hypothetical protein
MENGQVSSEDEAEKFRQEGREEILEWLLTREIINYSSYDNCYFIFNRFTDILTQLPWRRAEK